jgi:hypothetical protein
MVRARPRAAKLSELEERLRARAFVALEPLLGAQTIALPLITLVIGTAKR